MEQAGTRVPEYDKTGTITRVVFVNAATGFTVAHLTADDNPLPQVIVGELPPLAEGDPVRVKGRFEDDRRFGRRVRVETIEPLLPTTAAGVEKYLGSGSIPGIGKRLAQRIVEHLGEDVSQILDEDPERLREVPGIGRKKAEALAEVWQERVSQRRMLVALYGMGVGVALANRLRELYGSEAARVVAENPYRLAREVHGVGFLTADRLARAAGLAPDAPARIEAGIAFFLETQATEGHCFYPAEKLVEEVAGFLELDVMRVEPVLKEAVRNGTVVEESRWGDGEIALPWLKRSEDGAVRSLLRLMEPGPRLPQQRLSAAIDSGVRSSAVDLSMEQVDALAMALRHPVTIITGGPGTGKTTVIKAVIAAWRNLNMEALLCAPTGRAAKRMTEATGVEARTIHRLLEFDPSEAQFARDEGNPLPATAVVVDEVSMVDVWLMDSLLRALAPGTRLLLVGDKDQLESVGPGAVLRDCIGSGLVPCATLQEIHRQAAESLIIVNSHRILAGERPRTDPVSGRRPDFYFMEKEEPDDCLASLVELVRSRIPARFGFDPVRDVQVLTPMYKGALGAQNLNSMLQAALNPQGQEFRRGDRSYRSGDRVMQIRNNYTKEVFNGDVGFVDQVLSDGLVVRLTDGRKVKYDELDLDELTLAYAVTVHKSQGSEYPVVVLVMHTQHYVMLRRNLFYTALTRGKQLAVILGSGRAVRRAVANDVTHKRFTRLAEKLKEGRRTGDHD